MKIPLVFILVILVFVSCNKDTSPIVEKEVSIYYTGNRENDTYEFKVANNSGEPVWYFGYGESYPTYLLFALTSDGRKRGGPGWCGNGVYKVELIPGDSFLFDIAKPTKDQDWQVGIHIFYNIDDTEQLLLSQDLK